VTVNGKSIEVPCLDIIATKGSGNRDLRISIINRHPDKSVRVKCVPDELSSYSSATLYGVNASSKDAFNDIERPMEVASVEKGITLHRDGVHLEIEPHSVNVLVLYSKLLN
jgi:alpha-L-arabinofuranosidase